MSSDQDQHSIGDLIPEQTHGYVKNKKKKHKHKLPVEDHETYFCLQEEAHSEISEVEIVTKKKKKRKREESDPSTSENPDLNKKKRREYLDVCKDSTYLYDSLFHNGSQEENEIEKKQKKKKKHKEIELEPIDGDYILKAMKLATKKKQKDENEMEVEARSEVSEVDVVKKKKKKKQKVCDPSSSENPDFNTKRPREYLDVCNDSTYLCDSLFHNGSQEESKIEMKSKKKKKHKELKMEPIDSDYILNAMKLDIKKKQKDANGLISPKKERLSESSATNMESSYEKTKKKKEKLEENTENLDPASQDLFNDNESASFNKYDDHEMKVEGHSEVSEVDVVKKKKKKKKHKECDPSSSENPDFNTKRPRENLDVCNDLTYLCDSSFHNGSQEEGEIERKSKKKKKHKELKMEPIDDDYILKAMKLDIKKKHKDVNGLISPKKERLSESSATNMESSYEKTKKEKLEENTENLLFNDTESASFNKYDDHEMEVEGHSEVLEVDIVKKKKKKKKHKECDASTSENPDFNIKRPTKYLDMSSDSTYLYDSLCHNGSQEESEIENKPKKMKKHKELKMEPIDDDYILKAMKLDIKKKHKDELSKSNVDDDNIIFNSVDTDSSISSPDRENDETIKWDKLEDRLEITDEEAQKVFDMVIIQPYEVPKLHELLTRSSGLTQVQKAMISAMGLNVKTGPYSRREDEMIMQNWQEFCELHKWEVDNTAPFLNFRRKIVMKKYEKTKFLQFISHGLDNRLAHSVYQRFRRLFINSNQKKGKFCPAEDKIIKRYIEEKKSKTPYSDLSKLLNRPRFSIIKRVEFLNQSAKCFERITWNQDNINKFVKHLMSVKNTTDYRDLKTKKISKEEWNKVSKKMNGIPVRKLTQGWLSRIYPMLFSENFGTVAAKLKLVKLLYKQKVDDWKTVKWADMALHFEGFTGPTVYAMCRQLVRYYVPERMRSNLKESVEYLYTNYYAQTSFRNDEDFPKIVYVSGNFVVQKGSNSRNLKLKDL